MTENEFDAISRMAAWVRDFGHEKPRYFIGDIERLMTMANECSELREKHAKLVEAARAVVDSYSESEDEHEWMTIDIDTNAVETLRKALDDDA